jgi:hypothetical protein
VERDVRSVVAAVGAAAGSEPVEESWTSATDFDAALRDRLAALLAGEDGMRAPVLATGAGHDAGILSAAGIPTAMLFVRNPSGVSHSPQRARRASRLSSRSRGTRSCRGGTGMRAFWCEQAWLERGRFPAFGWPSGVSL